MRRLSVLLLCLIAPPQAYAEMLVSPVARGNAGGTHVSGVFVNSDVEYDTDGADPDIERSILGVEFGYGLSADTDFVAQLGFIIDSEIDYFDEDGSGLLFGAGVRSNFYRDGQMSVHGFGVFSYQAEKFEYEILGEDIELKVNTWEVHAGSVASYAATPTIRPYGGAELILIDDGKIEVDPGSTDDDIERDDIFNLKLGCNFAVNTWDLRPEVTLFGEQTFLIAAGTAF